MEETGNLPLSLLIPLSNCERAPWPASLREAFEFESLFKAWIASFPLSLSSSIAIVAFCSSLSFLESLLSTFAVCFFSVNSCPFWLNQGCYRSFAKSLAFPASASVWPRVFDSANSFKSLPMSLGFKLCATSRYRFSSSITGLSFSRSSSRSGRAPSFCSCSAFL